MSREFRNNELLYFENYRFNKYLLNITAGYKTLFCYFFFSIFVQNIFLSKRAQCVFKNWRGRRSINAGTVAFIRGMLSRDLRRETERKYEYILIVDSRFSLYTLDFFTRTALFIAAIAMFVTLPPTDTPLLHPITYFIYYYYYGL